MHNHRTNKKPLLPLSMASSALINFIFKTTYRKEIIAIIILKLLAITLLWALFFSHPVSKQLTNAKLVQHFTQRSALAP